MAWVAQALVEPITFHQFIHSGFKGADFNDFLPPTFKTAVFGLIIGLVACFQGMRTRGGAEPAWVARRQAPWSYLRCL